MAHEEARTVTVELPVGCPEAEGHDCPVAEHRHANRRRATDRAPARVAQLVVAILGAVGAAGGGWVAREKVAASDASSTAAHALAVDQQARQQIELLKVEINGRLLLIQQQQEQTNERLRELLERSRERRGGQP